MSDPEMKELAQFYVRSFGGRMEHVIDLLEDKRSRLQSIKLQAAIDALNQMIEGDDIPRQPAVRIAVMCRMAGGGVIKPYQPVQSCQNCDEGYITVPHHKGYDVYRNWTGEHTMVVACGCSAGKMKSNAAMRPCRSLENYEQEFPHWKEEFAVRHLEWMAGRGVAWAIQELAKIKNPTPKRFENTVGDNGLTLFQEELGHEQERYTEPAYEDEQEQSGEEAGCGHSGSENVPF